MIDQYLPSESIEKVSATLETIKQSRDHSDPKSSNWKDYVNKLFRAFGFSTQENYPRISTLSLSDGHHLPKAVAVFIQPGESFDELVPGLSWETFALFATSYYKVDWAVYTDGLQLMVIQYQRDKIKQRLFWQEFDQVICKQSLVEFFPIFMVFNIIKTAKDPAKMQVEKPIKKSENGGSVAKESKSVIVREFLRQLLERANTKTPLHAKATLGFHNNFSVNAGKKGLSYGYIVVMDRGIVNLYIDNGNKEWNKDEFTRLYEHKTEIEEVFGEKLEWHLMPKQKSSYIRFTVSGYNLRNTDTWVEFQDKLIDAMIRLEKAFRPYING